MINGGARVAFGGVGLVWRARRAARVRASFWRGAAFRESFGACCCRRSIRARRPAVFAARTSLAPSTSDTPRRDRIRCPRDVAPSTMHASRIRSRGENTLTREHQMWSVRRYESETRTTMTRERNSIAGRVDGSRPTRRGGPWRGSHFRRTQLSAHAVLGRLAAPGQ